MQGDAEIVIEVDDNLRPRCPLCLREWAFEPTSPMRRIRDTINVHVGRVHGEEGRSKSIIVASVVLPLRVPKEATA